MKNIICLVPLYLVLACSAQTGTSRQWRVSLLAADEMGRPVVGAHVWVAYRDPGPGESADPFTPNNWAIAGLTDSNGMFEASHMDEAVELGLHAQKDGYYGFFMQHHLGFDLSRHPERGDMKATLILKRIRNPIAMYGKSVNLGLPAFDQPVGFDLMAGDWVAPFGKGARPDIIFTGHLEKRAEGDSDYRLLVSFPNPDDGIQAFASPRLPAGEGSGLRSSHEAPADGYQATWLQESTQRPGQSPQTSRDPQRNYFLRVRTVLDEQGKIKTALYGKIYGDFLQFRYYLNASPNDRNVEFDPKRNLLSGLKSTERVMQP